MATTESTCFFVICKKKREDNSITGLIQHELTMTSLI